MKSLEGICGKGRAARSSLVQAVYKCSILDDLSCFGGYRLGACTVDYCSTWFKRHVLEPFFVYIINNW